MKTCPNCKVSVKGGNYCPLCGKCIDEEISENKKTGNFPDYAPTLVDHSESVWKILSKLAFWGIIVCMAINLFLNKTVSWSLYVLFSLLYLHLVVFHSIYKKMSFANIITKIAIYTPCLLLFLELYTGSWGWGMCYAVPFLWLALTITSAVLMIANGWVNYEMFKPTLTMAILSTILLGLLFGFKEVFWPILITFFVCWSLICFMFMFRFKRTVRSIQKEFRL
ncbi:MAG: hypothetical protein IJZ26_02000 [Clostridia bacterium]|nr:hypothetical protein [Clostridia bacterium]MBQ9786165.1 hypothetical protein [Clostridia bacterium]